ncbi:phosphoesterase [Thermaurantimonas aggregans]|uniref:Phosphoesterase n=1 Tax=Thermaurantimonas aggregans TaxID=2173829 RepID=A0A401XKK1_9FLAO|nr:ligase-associated DNA damage response endonuclease PdeM [Thermaurantimonas aggregans]MCX8149353.1 ligase-associated DNA damage response endonuclease PdeM [Thermaurantimonas aggregans]GCD77501.1 phosphoesterase [Thermaurantimonas aggregans]
MIRTENLSYFPFELKSHTFHLLPEKALYWPLHKMLILADVHIGKISHFRRAGASLPLAAANKQIVKLQELINRVQPSAIVFLGDLFHSDFNSEWNAFQSVLKAHPDKEFILIEGNHDVLDVQIYRQTGVEVKSQLVIDGFILSHHPLEVNNNHTNLYTLCGHLHPGYLLEGKGRQRLRLPCLWLSKHQAVLPAYGDFTGTYPIEPQSGDIVFLISGLQINRLDF